MELPVYFLNEKDGLPFANTKFCLTIAEEKIPYFANKQNKVVLAITQFENTIDLYYNIENLKLKTYPVGLLCEVIKKESSGPNFTVHLDVLKRVEIHNYTEDDCVLVNYTIVDEDFLPQETQVSNYMSQTIRLIRNNLHLLPEDFQKTFKESENLIPRINVIANYFLTEYKSRLQYLLSLSHIDGFNILIHSLSEHDFNTQVPTQAATKVLLTTQNIQEKFDSTTLPDEVRQHTRRELDKLSTLQEKSQEYGSTLDYLSWILEIPWGKYSYNNQHNLDELVDTLDKTHYGLDIVKQYILEHMAIEKLSNGSAGTVLCFVGPPGTGKTTIAKDIATASNRKLVRIALGGLSDEAEIRGHRRSYMASRPGRIIVGLKKAGTLDPLILLDEIDKITTHKGDPNSALLEVLDKEQNTHFVDRYLEVPVDISKAMFICTANNRDDIPQALADRMEFIVFKEYSFEERQAIIKSYLLPKLSKELCVENLSITFTNESLDLIAKTSAIRQIERDIKRLLRKAVVDILVHKKTNVDIDYDYTLNTINKPTEAIRRVGFI